MRKQFIKQFYKHNKVLFIVSFFMMICLASVNLIISYLLQQLSAISMGQSLGPLVPMVKSCVLMILFFLLLRSFLRCTYSQMFIVAMLHFRVFSMLVWI